MDIYESSLYDDLGADELADEAQGFGTVDDLDLHGADARAFVDPALAGNPDEPLAIASD